MVVEVSLAAARNVALREKLGSRMRSRADRKLITTRLGHISYAATEALTQQPQANNEVVSQYTRFRFGKRFVFCLSFRSSTKRENKREAEMLIAAPIV